MKSHSKSLLQSLIIAIFLLFCFSIQVSAQQAELEWDPDASQVAGYNVHYGQVTRQYPNVVNAGANTTCALQNLSDPPYFIAVTAYDNNNNQSAFSSELVIYSMAASAGAGGSIAPAGKFFQAQGASQTFAITPAAGFNVADVQVDGTSVGAVTAYTFSSVSTNHNISATFTPITYTITPTAGSNGSIFPATAVTVNSEGSQTFTITPATGYQVSSLLVDGSSVGAATTYTFSNVAAGHTIAATFAQTTPTISATVQYLTSNSGGSISPSGTVNVPAGEKKTFKIIPAAYNQISAVLVDGQPVGAVSSYTFKDVTADHTIVAAFTRNSYHLTTNIKGAGSVSPKGTVSVPPGMDKTYTITPAAHWQISAVKVDGSPIGEAPGATGLNYTSTGKSSIFTLPNVDNDHTIEVAFSEIPPPVADAGPDQVVTTSSTVTLDGSNSTDTADGIASYKWAQISGHPVKLSTPHEPVCTFTPPNLANAMMLAFKLTVTNKGGVSKSDYCFVNVSASDQAPLANAGPGQIVQAASIVDLDGSVSSESDGTSATYKWIQTEGPRVEIANANSRQASFAAPDPGPLGASLIFQLQVTDPFGLTTRDQCTVNVINMDQPPVANAGNNQTAVEASAVTLDGTGSQAAGTSAITYRWKQIRGLPVTLSDPSAATPVFTAPSDASGQDADLLFMLTVTDADSLLSTTAECTVTIASN